MNQTFSRRKIGEIRNYLNEEVRSIKKFEVF